MDAVRLRLTQAAEWTVAVVFLVATVGVTFMIVREMTSIGRPADRSQPGVTPAVAPAALPALSIPVSRLRLPGAREIRLGDSLERVSSVLGREAETGVQVAEQGRTGTRLTRGYEFGRVRFMLVFEPFEQNGEFRVAGIYVQ